MTAERPTLFILGVRNDAFGAVGMYVATDNQDERNLDVKNTSNQSLIRVSLTPSSFKWGVKFQTAVSKLDADTDGPQMWNIFNPVHSALLLRRNKAAPEMKDRIHITLS